MLDTLRIGQKVWHKDIYGGQEEMKIVGIRKNEIELEGDYSGGTHGTYGKSWHPINRIIFKKEIWVIDEDWYLIKSFKTEEACNKWLRTIQTFSKYYIELIMVPFKFIK